MSSRGGVFKSGNGRRLGECEDAHDHERKAQDLEERGQALRVDVLAESETDGDGDEWLCDRERRKR